MVVPPVIRGVLAPVLMPFGAQLLRPDTERFISNCQWIASKGVGLAIFGTNSEANSLSLAEKKHQLDRLLASPGIDRHR
jgi:4-hydroxy-tetrahydrodipicolinate synthase